MSRFPHAPVDLISDMFIGGEYRSVVPDLRAKPVTVAAGRANEASRLAPTSSTFVLGNADGVYSPRNPTGPYYGQLGRSTPLRQAIRNDHDAMGTAVSGGWGTSDGGFTWGVEGVGTPYSKSSGSAKQVVTGTNTFLATYLSGADASFRTVRTAVTVSLAGISAVTGARLEPTLTLRRASSTDYYLMRLNIQPGGDVELVMTHYDGTSIRAPWLVLDGWAGERLRMAALIEGHSLFGKVWRVDTEPEPYGWQLQGMIKTDTLPGAGSVGIRSGVAFGNTNANPITFVYDDWEVSTPIGFTEVAKWTQKQDKSTRDLTVPIEAKGITRRLGQGQSPQRSTLFRAITDQGTAVAYWPCEDGKDSTGIASGLANGIPMQVIGTPRYATYSDIPSTAPICELATSYWFGKVVPYTGTGDIYVSMLVHVPAGGTVDQDPFFQVRTTGSAMYWNLRYGAGGTLQLEAYTADIGLLLNTGPIGFNMDDKRLRLALSLSENGSGGVDWSISTLQVGDTSGGTFGGTLAGATVNACTDLLINTLAHMDQVAIGQIAIWPEILSLFDLWLELTAYDGESSGTRAQRLCAENGIVFVPVGDPDLTTWMGPQKPGTLLDLIQECVDVDGGLLFEPVGVLGIGYRTRESLYNQTALLTVAYGNLSEVWEPVEDDQLTRNDVQVTRKDGSNVRAVQLDGPLSVLPPDQGGVGRYDTAITVNCLNDGQLPDIAGERLHLGTVDEPRYPVLKLNLASAGFAASTPLTTQVLALGLGDRLVVTGPPAGGSPDDIEQLAQGITRTIGAWDYRVALNCTPASPWTVFTLDSDRLTPNDCVLTDNETSSDTTVRFTTVTGALWTTSGGEMPIPVTIAGERVSVTAISGASSPQTATVTRHLNVTKEQTAGTAVELTSPAVLAR